MTLPYTFTPGTIASATEVNENFNHVMGIVGADSTTEDMKPSGDVLLGPRDAVQLTAKGDTDTTGTGTKYFQVGWNCDMYNEGSTFRQRRIVNNEGATVLRVGSTGVEALATARTDSTLDEQLQTAVGIRPHYSNGSQNPWVYINPSWKLQWRDQVADQSTHLNYRNTLTFLDLSQSNDMWLYGSAPQDEINWTGAATILKSTTRVDLNIYDLNLTASGVTLPDRIAGAMITVLAKWQSAGSSTNFADKLLLRVYGNDTGDSLSIKTGFIVTPSYKVGDSPRTYYCQTQGMVRFGSSQTNKGKFVVELRKSMLDQYLTTIDTGTGNNAQMSDWSLGVVVQGIYF